MTWGGFVDVALRSGSSEFVTLSVTIHFQEAAATVQKAILARAIVQLDNQKHSHSDRHNNQQHEVISRQLETSDTEIGIPTSSYLLQIATRPEEQVIGKGKVTWPKNHKVPNSRQAAKGHLVSHK
ncbi:hypothetical protein Cantr_06112 [Candida viswanathii]|uniref:Uncharacterized protein n=1 Tax=Candida viswanathii TaxID=5486 RepID=A0A367XUR7_9ASCO|nr:hypothetical protein Cantr_06112 [Candida viswanathii]